MLRNTSACAEKRAHAAPAARSPRKYLRVRGEEEIRIMESGAGAEIPPRARRRDGGEGKKARIFGNTSACAEKSP